MEYYTKLLEINMWTEINSEFGDVDILEHMQTCSYKRTMKLYILKKYQVA